MSLSVAICNVLGQGTPTDKNFKYATVSNAKKVSLHYSGTAKIHLRLGNYRATNASRIGKVDLHIDLVRATESGLRPNRFVYALNGQHLDKNILAGGSTPVALSEYGYGYGSSTDHFDAANISNLSDLVEAFPANRNFTKLVRGISDIYNIYTITPHATTLEYRGRKYDTALFVEKSFVGKLMVSIEQAYVSDEVPGRILRTTIQGHFDNGSPAGRTELSLVSADLE